MRTAIYGWRLRSKRVDIGSPSPSALLKKLQNPVFLQSKIPYDISAIIGDFLYTNCLRILKPKRPHTASSPSENIVFSYFLTENWLSSKENTPDAYS